MKAKVLWSACALSACFAACTNEDFLSESQNMENAVGQNEIVGHDLVSKGMRVVAVKGGADTRVNESGWEVNDQLGLAWYKVGQTIEEEQTEDMWEKLLSGGTFATDGTCDNIYANHIFTNISGSPSGFETTTNVYQGAYFMYFPYRPLDAVKPLVLEPNKAAQTMDFREEVMNKSTWISAQDFLSAGEGVDENNQLEKSFYLAPIVNAIGIDATPEEAISQNSFMSQLKITGLTLNLGEENELFLPKAQVVTRFLPAVKYVAGTNVVDEEATQQALYKATDKVADAANNGKIYLYNESVDDAYTSSLTTEVNNPDFTLAATRQVRMFTFPTRNTTTNWDSHAFAQVPVVSPNGYKLGFFNVNVANSEGFISKLERILGADDPSTLQKVHRKGNDVLPIGKEMVANLLAKDFVPDTYVTSEGQWNEMMDLYDALYACGVRYHDGVGAKEDNEKDLPVIRIGKKVEFKGVNGTIKTPQNVTIKVMSESGSKDNVMVIAANTEWPSNLVTDSDEKLYMEVKKNITLTVGDKLTLDADIDNYGTVSAGYLTYIGTNDGGKITNHYVGTQEAPDRKNGRVEVVYGSYVYPASSDNGIVAYELTGEANEAAMINRLVLGKNNTNDRYAHVNTLVVPAGLTLNLNATSEGSINDDPYEGAETNGLNMPDLVGDDYAVDVELNGGSVFSDGTNKEVNNLYAVGGSSTATDIDVVDDITTLNGATLNVESDDPVKQTFDLVNINNHGTLNANTNMTVKVVNNYISGTIIVASGCEIIYSVHGEAGYLQDGKADGTIREQGAYVPDAEELAECVQAVNDAWTGGSNPLKNETGFGDAGKLENLAETIHGYANDDKAIRVNTLIQALNDWFEEYYGDVDHNVTKKSISADDLRDFENKANYRFLN